MSSILQAQKDFWREYLKGLSGWAGDSRSLGLQAATVSSEGFTEVLQTVPIDQLHQGNHCGDGCVLLLVWAILLHS